MAEPLVCVRGRNKRYRGQLDVDALTFAFKAGMITDLLGWYGAGESTTLRLVLGLARQTAGEAPVFGRRYRDRSPLAFRDAGVPMGHPFRVYGRLNVTWVTPLGEDVASTS